MGHRLSRHANDQTSAHLGQGEFGVGEHVGEAVADGLLDLIGADVAGSVARFVEDALRAPEGHIVNDPGGGAVHLHPLGLVPLLDNRRRFPARWSWVDAEYPLRSDGLNLLAPCPQEEPESQPHLADD